MTLVTLYSLDVGSFALCTVLILASVLPAVAISSFELRAVTSLGFALHAVELCAYFFYSVLHDLGCAFSQCNFSVFF